MTIFDEVRKILMSPSSTLQGLAGAVGLTPEELFEGESFQGVDLQDEPLDLILRLDSDFEGAILSREQSKALRAGRGVAAKRAKHAKLKNLQEYRRDSIEGFVQRYFAQGVWEEALSVLWSPLSKSAVDIDKWSGMTQYYVPDAVRYISANEDNLSNPLSDAIVSFLLKVKMMRLPLGGDVIAALEQAGQVLVPETMEKVVDFNYCTERFVMRWLEKIEQYQHTGSGRDMFFEALSLSMLGPSSPSSSYVESILSQARSLNEVRALVRRLSKKRIDRSLGSMIARLLAKKATSQKEITDTALDREINPYVRSAFRQLIISSSNPIGRRSMIDIIAAGGKNSSGIELDAVLMGLDFDDSISFMQPHWDRITSHHRSVAIDAISSKSRTAEHRNRVRKLRKRLSVG
uniref:hypothetical protein n=1 Tax=Palleronia sp. TaxID=1940284 RepID=UPI0035C82066